MNILRSIAMAFSMFSIVPMPHVEWKSENMRYMLAMLPLVGIVIGISLWLFSLASSALEFNSLLFASGVTLIPILLTGGIHMDGFADTVDALASHASPEKKREILKDTHTGAFAVIYVCAYFIAYFAFASSLTPCVETVLMLGLFHIISRTVTGFSAVAFAMSQNQGTLRSFNEASNKLPALIILVAEFACAVAMLFLVNNVAAVIPPAVAIVTALIVRAMAKKQFGGMSGDIAGFLLEMSELLMLVSFVITERAVAI